MDGWMDGRIGRKVLDAIRICSHYVLGTTGNTGTTGKAGTTGKTGTTGKIGKIGKTSKTKWRDGKTTEKCEGGGRTEIEKRVAGWLGGADAYMGLTLADPSCHSPGVNVVMFGQPDCLPRGLSGHILRLHRVKVGGTYLYCTPIYVLFYSHNYLWFVSIHFSLSPKPTRYLRTQIPDPVTDLQ